MYMPSFVKGKIQYLPQIEESEGKKKGVKMQILYSWHPLKGAEE